MQGLPEIGDVLDDTYQVKSLLGQGGFGAVYLGHQLSMDRDVAIKVLVAHAMRVDEMIERFRREVMAVRNLSHPNTIRIYDFRDGEDGFLYYVMEYIKGPTLKDVIKGDGPMPVARVKHILRQVLKSLSEAHSYGIVHRDLKPANVMLADLHGETDFVKVVDFGIAKIVNDSEDNDDDADPLTSAGVLVGTLRYMSPEQITGQGIGPRSDLYAAALIGVEMLTGKSVFEGTGRWEVLHKQISDDPVEVPEEVQNSELGPIFRKALEKQPDERYQSAEEMLKAIDGVLDQAASAPTPEVSATPEVAAPAPAQPDEDDEATMMAELPSDFKAPAAATTPQPNPPVQLQPQAAFVPPEDTGEFDVEGGTSKGLLVGIAAFAVILVVLGAVAFTQMGGDDADAEAEAAVTPPPAPLEKEAPQVAEKEEPKEEEKPEVKQRFVRVTTPGVKAQIFDGEELVGSTPVRIYVSGAENYSIKADGYEAQVLDFSKDEETEVEIQLAKIGGEEPAPTVAEKPTTKPATTTTSTKPKPTETADPGWVDIAAKPKPKPKPAETADPGWVDVTAKPKPKKEEKKKPEVPLF